MKDYLFGLPVTTSVYFLHIYTHIHIQSTFFFMPLLQTTQSQVSYLECWHFASLSKYNKNLHLFPEVLLILAFQARHFAVCFRVELTLWFSSSFR